MTRRRLLLALVPANALLLLVARDGWAVAAAVCGALGCLLAYLSARPTGGGSGRSR
ncbi:hypothetical protein K7640_13630 [Micromonospora sp. PLK6-60]|uniref:hypothetical protein n=1 Tax=Micromonospora sp. PLK6-60 TaxID=2873383 RepID=UPI001CA66C08|nr:hypothetical protein [Micromonospora sp. PLK6-60]MBY8872876.1 hypothetical protein [Micromonospora sp. PLK6-60]